MSDKKSFSDRVDVINSQKTIGMKVQACILELKGHQQEVILSGLIREYLQESGAFYNTNAGQFYFVNKTKQLIKVSYEGKRYAPTQEFINFLNSKPKLNSTVRSFAFVFQDIVQAIDNEEYIQVKKNFYFNSDTYTLYMYNNNGSILKITDKKKRIVNNGMDGMFFVNTNSDILDFKQIKISKNKNYLDKLLIEKINFQKTEYLNKREQQDLFRIWILSLLFESIQPTKPLVVFQGEAGSGKTDSLKAVGKILFGKHFSEKPIQKDIRDFYSSVVNNYYYQIDNLDANKPDWFEDIIASITTGSNLEMRALYKNINDAPVLIEPHIFISVSTMNASFTRQDIASRTILFSVARLKKYDNNFIPAIIKNRNNILREIIDMSQDIIGLLKKNSKIDSSTTLRLADFADFAIKAKNLFGFDPTLLEKINAVQDDFALQNDPITDIISSVLRKDMYGIEDKTASQLFKIFKSASIEDLGTKFLYGSARSLGIQMKQKEKNIQRFFDMETKIKSGYRYYTIRQKMEQFKEF